MYGANRTRAIKVCHVAMGDLWAGAEVQLLVLMKYLVRFPEFECSAILFNEGRLADELRKLPLSVSIISEKNHSPLALASRLAEMFRQIRPDIVHTHKYKDSIIGSIVARSLRIPHVVRVVHGMPEPFKGYKNLKMASYALVDRFVIRWFIDKVVAVSFDIEKILARSYGADRVVCIHNGVDLEDVQVLACRSLKRKEWQIDEKTIIIGTVGRLVPVKGLTILLEAFRLLLKSGENMMLFLVGDGPLRSHLEAEVKRLEIDHSVVFAGHQEHIYDFINMMDIFVLPSLHEGIPMVLLEALALERPVVASDVGGIPEVLSHGVSGILVKPSDAMALAAGLTEVMCDRTKAMALGAAGRSQVEHEFDARFMASRVAATYRSL